MSETNDDGLDGSPIQTNSVAMQLNNNNNTGADLLNRPTSFAAPSIEFHPPNSNDTERTPSIQRQDSFEKVNHLDIKCTASKQSTPSLEERRRTYRSCGSSGRGSGSGEVSQDESILVESMESGYVGDRRRSSTFIDKELMESISEEVRKKERTQENPIEIVKDERPIKHMKRSRDEISNSLEMYPHSKVPKINIDNPEIEEAHKELNDSIDDLQTKGVTRESLKRFGNATQQLHALGSIEYKNVTQDLVAFEMSQTGNQAVGDYTRSVSVDNKVPSSHQDVKPEDKEPSSPESFELTSEDLEGISSEKQPECKRDVEHLSVQTANISVSNDSPLSPGIQREESLEIVPSVDNIDTSVQAGQHGLAILDIKEPSCQKEVLQSCGQCKVQSCYQPICLKVQEIMSYLKDCLERSRFKPMCLECQHVVACLYHHSNICEELKCPVPFCAFFRQYSGISIHHCIAKLVTLNKKRVLIMTLMEYGWLREDHEYDWVANDFKDFWTQRDTSKLYLLNDFLQDYSGYGTFNTVQMCIDGSSGVPTRTYAIKKCNVPQDNRQEILDIMSKVTNTVFPQIADHLWCRLSDNSAYICTKLVKGGSLKRLINSSSEQDLRTLEKEKLFYFDQACMVAVHLRDSLKIVLLDWSSDHISLDDTRQQLIFHDFSSAVVLDVAKRYTAWNKKQLKPHLTPIEVCRKQSRTSQSDVWGVGTLFYELCHRKTTFFHMSHEHPEVVRNKIGCGYKPDMTWCDNTQLLSLLNNCWRDDPNQRIFMQDARRHCIFIEDRFVPCDHSAFQPNSVQIQ